MNLNRDGTEPRNISLIEAINDCRVLELGEKSVKLLWSGYGDGCTGDIPEMSKNHQPILESVFIKSLSKFQNVCFSVRFHLSTNATVCRCFRCNDYSR